MRDQTAEISLLGNRQENQDRVKVINSEGATLIMAVDGMGGHANGARAAELAIEVIEKNFLIKPGFFQLFLLVFVPCQPFDLYSE